MNVKDILLQYGKETGLGRLVLDKNDKCTLILNDAFLVCFEPAATRDGFFVFSVLEDVDTNDKECLLKLLQSNLFGSETGHASIGYDPVTRSAVMFQYFDNDLTDYTLFKNRLEEFVSFLHYWRAKTNDPDKKGR